MNSRDDVMGDDGLASYRLLEISVDLEGNGETVEHS